MKQNTYRNRKKRIIYHVPDVRKVIIIIFYIEIVLILIQSDFYAIIKILQYCFEIFAYSILCSVFCLFATRKKLKKNKKR